jgi:hypothetical protein
MKSKSDSENTAGGGCSSHGLLADLPSVDHWMRATHYHCKECGGEVTFLTRMNWEVKNGVRAIGLCRGCALVMVEAEYRGVWWTPLETVAEKRRSIFG